jgi:(2Fe-2S) ferredoxin
MKAHGTSEDLIRKLFCRFLFVFLRGGEALLLFATSGALPDIISTVIVPHRLQHSPACRALATRRRMALAAVAASLPATPKPGKGGCEGRATGLLHASNAADGLWPLTFDSAYSTLTSLQRKRYLFVCINRRAEDNPKGCCAAKDSEEVYRALKGEIAARGLAKLEARVCTSSCLDQCGTGVTVLVEPDHFFYGHVTVADVPQIVDGLVNGQPVKRLVVTDDPQ